MIRKRRCLIFSTRKDDGEWETGVYMKDRSTVEYFDSYGDAMNTAHSLRKLLGKKNPCVVRVCIMETLVNFDP